MSTPVTYSINGKNYDVTTTTDSNDPTKEIVTVSKNNDNVTGQEIKESTKYYQDIMIQVNELNTPPPPQGGQDGGRRRRSSKKAKKAKKAKKSKKARKAKKSRKH